jgi:hypothetical protein
VPITASTLPQPRRQKQGNHRHQQRQAEQLLVGLSLFELALVVCGFKLAAPKTSRADLVAGKLSAVPGGFICHGAWAV